MTIALALLLTASIGSDVTPICDGNMPSATALAKKLEGAPGLRRLPEKSDVTTYFDDRTTTLWWVAGRQQAAFPATLCGRLGGSVRVRCEGDRKACKALGAKMTKAKL